MTEQPVPMHRRARTPNYDRFPTVPVAGTCHTGWERIGRALRATGARVTVIETYPGVRDKEIAALLHALDPDETVDATEALLAPAQIDRIVAPFLGEDPVFGYLTSLTIEDFYDQAALGRLRERVAAAPGSVVVHGPGASLLADGLLVLMDMPRWESQLRMRRGEFTNLGAANAGVRWQQQYKRAYFVDWRVADRHKRALLARLDFTVDTTDPEQPRMINGEVMRRGLSSIAGRPFRVVPYFDPAPWGGQWMKTVCDLPDDEPNYGWCFDCVPEENSLLLDLGGARFEMPAANLVFAEPRALLGDAVYGRFGDEFPIRFDFLDTIEGGSLSLQVHPLTEYIQHTFGMHYTQDESYYLLDAEPSGGVFLGVRSGVDRAEMLRALREAEAGGEPFDAERYVNLFPARKHDHFLIPAGTIHSSRRAMVLEISATPYIFTFKLWDWDRPGLDGEPRPVHIDHGERVIQWHRDTSFAREQLVNRITPLASGDGWREERTGLHEAEFIETRRHWFTGVAPHLSRSGVEVLNLVEGEDAIVRSPDDAFEPFEVHYAETFIVPAAAGPYVIEAGARAAGTECATIKAFVRTHAPAAVP
ncbi:MAG TPA: class I mannose-6-phosphate isomerase [Actinomycetota bacterium]